MQQIKLDAYVAPIGRYDQAMYQAKRSGRNCYRIYQELIDLELLQADTVEES